MTVKELIKELKKLDPNAKVYFDHPFLTSWLVDGVETLDDQVFIFSEDCEPIRNNT
jgi:hypothetical protein